MIIGAHYYPWFGKPRHAILGAGEWISGYTNNPVLGEYSCRNEKVISQHIQWAKDAGIDFFIFNWVGKETWDDFTVKNYFLQSPAMKNIRFCFQYDSYQALNKLGRTSLYNLDDNYLAFQTKGDKLVDDFIYLADQYFNHPQYMKVNGKPVILVYVLREYLNAAKYFRIIEQSLEMKGINLFLVGDIVFWSKITEIKKIRPQHVFKQPLNKVITLIDVIKHARLKKNDPVNWETEFIKAVTCYNLYLPSIRYNFLADTEKVFQSYFNLYKEFNVSFIPTIIPGYNDRKLSGDHRPVIDRGDGKFFTEFWKIASNYVDPSINMLFITSFNEWHEGTEIEPSYEHGTKYIELVRKLKNSCSS